MVYGCGSPGINVKRDAEVSKGFLNDLVILIDDLLRSDPQLLGFDGYRYAMFI